MPNPTVETIRYVTATVFNMNMKDFNECRERKFAHARQIAMYLSRKLTPKSYPQIGKVFKRDHTTIIYGVEAVEKPMTNGDLKMIGTVQRVKEELEARGYTCAMRDWIIV